MNPKNKVELSRSPVLAYKEALKLFNEHVENQIKIKNELEK